MVFLLTIQLRPLSYRLLPCTSSSAPWRARLAYHCHAYLYAYRGGLAVYVVERHHSAEMFDFISNRTRKIDPKKGALKPSLSHKVRPKRAWIDTPKLPQVTIFTIITHAMRRPLVARGVGDLGPAKAESPTLFYFPNLFRYFLTYYVTY